MSVLAVYDCMLFLMYAARPERVHETFELIDDRRVTYCLSAEVIAEIRDVLTRPKHQQRFPGLTRSRVDEVIAEISRQAHFVKMVPDLYQLERDPKDSKYINLALSAGARYLVNQRQRPSRSDERSTADGRTVPSAVSTPRDLASCRLCGSHRPLGDVERIPSTDPATTSRIAVGTEARRAEGELEATVFEGVGYMPMGLPTDSKLELL